MTVIVLGFLIGRLRKITWSQVQWLTPVILALGRLRQVDPKFKSSLGYIARLFFKKTNRNITLNKPKKKKLEQFLLIFFFIVNFPWAFLWTMSPLYVVLSVSYYSDDNLQDISMVNARTGFYLLANVPILESFDLSPFLFTQEQATGFKCHILTQFWGLRLNRHLHLWGSCWSWHCVVMDSSGNLPIEGSQYSPLSGWQLAACCPVSEARLLLSNRLTDTSSIYKKQACKQTNRKALAHRST